MLGAIVLVPTAAATGSVALAGFALDSVLEIGASGVVIWELAGNDDARRDRALRLIGYAFALLAAYLVTQSTIALATGHRPDASDIGLTW
ncbi:MAG: cation transporter, partial [Solirubrobacteraceae bacterium]